MFSTNTILPKIWALFYVFNERYFRNLGLTFIFKKHAGKSLGKYITEIRFEKAKYLLENTNMKSSEIGKYVGYPNPSYFTMMFRNRYGCTPVQYRERMK
nr:AraC family transcriptional regulator [Paenibacillus sp. CECT 9249]